MAWNRRKKVRFARGMWMARLVAVSVAGVCVALWYVWLRVQMVNEGYQIRDKERRLSCLKKENQVLRMKIAQMKSPKNIEAMIREKAVGLMTTKSWQLVVLPKTVASETFRAYEPRTQEASLMETLRPAEPPPRVPMHG